MEGRREARGRALELLYEAEIKDTSTTELISALPVPPDVYCVVLTEGVDEHRAEIAGLLRDHARGWSLERMPAGERSPAVERALWRVATYELRHQQKVPVGVVISEAVDLASEFSTDDSGRF